MYANNTQYELHFLTRRLQKIAESQMFREWFLYQNEERRYTGTKTSHKVQDSTDLKFDILLKKMFNQR